MLFPGKGVLQVAIRMVGLDLDGTLFNSKKELTAHTCAVLAAAARKGVAVVPATGRPRIGLPQALLAIPGIRYAVVSNGAAVCDLCTGERLYTDCMPLDAAVDILRRTRTLEVVQGAFIGDWGYMEEIGRQRIRALDLVAAMQEYLISSRKIVPDLPAYVAQRGEAPEKVVINFLKTPDGKARFREETVAVVRQYPEVSFVSGGVGNIEIIHKSAGKGSALLKLEMEEALSMKPVRMKRGLRRRDGRTKGFFSLPFAGEVFSSVTIDCGEPLSEEMLQRKVLHVVKQADGEILRGKGIVKSSSGNLVFHFTPGSLLIEPVNMKGNQLCFIGTGLDGQQIRALFNGEL